MNVTATTVTATPSKTHHHHRHHPSTSTDARYLRGALGLILGFMVAEIAAGIAASSLVLLSDAAHMLTDAGAIGLALVAARLAARPASGRLTYGWKRAEILSAQANGLTLLVLATLFVAEGIGRLVHPTAVSGGPVLVTAIAGVVVNLAATWLLARADRRSLNVEGAFQHILSDLYAFGATAVAGLVVFVTGFDRADALAALTVAALMGRAGVVLVRASGRVFLEAAPAGLDPDEIGRTLARWTDVAEVHDLHVWEVTSGMPALSAHVLVVPQGDCHQVQHDLRDLLHDRWEIDHVTLQVDHVGPVVLAVSNRADDGRRPGHCVDPHGPTHHGH
ncbi:cation diffusion facilitator family transporter [Frankia sp. Cppng1_Ct_nod]|uniref:cation diffusion facilitator family transporter n=1 Tax=Frankia sp. Cppng1_Ct_nod TaxID=2897162 RepID=UPI0010416879|nr:cation diffusion facilitator family transporter [Frankia sp. Cppng1_Ct_nod]